MARPNRNESNKTSNNGASKRSGQKPAAQRTERGGKPKNQSMKGKQGRKDSKTPRVNYDNAREDKVAKQIVDDAKSGKYNDINDFLRNPNLLKAAGSIPVFPILGTNIGSADPAPGVLAVKWVPNFGNYDRGPLMATGEGKFPGKKFSPPPIALNQAADSTYSYVVHANSRNQSYDAADLFILMLAGSQVFAIIEAMKRAYGYAKTYVEQRLYTPDTELAAMGFQPADLRHNLGQAWFDINNLITQTRQIWIPSNFPIVNRWIEMNSNLYKDAEGEYAQTYIFVQLIYFWFEEVTSSTGGMLSRVQLEVNGEMQDFAPGDQDGTSASGTAGVYLWKEWVSVAQSMIDRLVRSQDRGIVYGDILKAYTAEQIYAIPEINYDYRIERLYTPEISMQIENLTLSRAGVCTGLMQYNNKLYPTFANNTSVTDDHAIETPLQFILNFHTTADPTPEMVLLATRYHSLGEIPVKYPLPNLEGGEPLESSGWATATAGSEIVRGVTIYTRPAPAIPPTTVEWADYRTNYLTMISRKAEAFLDFEAFDWHPFCFTTSSMPTQPWNPSSLVGKTEVYGSVAKRYYGDFDKYTTTDVELLDKINKVAFFSLYGVPQL